MTIPSLTGLRFFAAACVVISHAVPIIVLYDAPPWPLAVLSQIAGIGMTLFFVLSGFVIFLNYAGSISTGAGLWNFFVARFARLYPLFFLCVSFELLRSFSFSKPPALDALPYYTTLTQSWFYKIIGPNTLIYQYGWMSTVSWSISTEWMFYFAFPFIAATIFLFPSPRQKLLAGVALSLFALTAIMVVGFSGARLETFAVKAFGAYAADHQNSFSFWLRYFSPYVRIFEFALGCLCAAFYLGLTLPSSREQHFGAWLTAAALASVIVLHTLFFYADWSNPILRLVQQLRDNFGLALPCALLIFCCARYQNPVVGFFSNKWIVLAGEASYSIYLLHFLVIGAFRYEVAKITNWQVAIGSYLQLIVTLAAIIGLSLVSWRMIEVPSRRVIRGLLSVNPRTSARTASSQAPAAP